MTTGLLFSIAGGMLGMLGTSRIEQIAWRFIRLVGLLTLAILCLATIWQFRNPAAGGLSLTWRRMVLGGGAAAAAGAVGLVLAGPQAGRYANALRLLCLVAGACSLGAAVLMTLSAMSQQTSVVVLAIVNELFGAWLLGSITIAWLLGHAYLTATKMTLAPLRHYSRMLSFAISGRLAFLAVSLLLAWWLQSPGEFALWHQLQQWWLIVVLRVGVGLVAVAAFAYMVADCVRLRSTQSATGILYFGSVMAYVGELASRHLTQELGWPV